MHTDRKISVPREPGLIETRIPGLVDPYGRFRPNRPGGLGGFGGWGPKLG